MPRLRVALVAPTSTNYLITWLATPTDAGQPDVYAGRLVGLGGVASPSVRVTASPGNYSAPRIASLSTGPLVTNERPAFNPSIHPS